MNDEYGYLGFLRWFKRRFMIPSCKQRFFEPDGDKTSYEGNFLVRIAFLSEDNYLANESLKHQVK